MLPTVLFSCPTILSEWTEQFNLFQQFSWIELKTFPDWKSMRNSMEAMSTKTPFDLEASSSKDIQQFGLIKSDMVLVSVSRNAYKIFVEPNFVRDQEKLRVVQ